ncbi:MAG: tyrosine-type recombinase/integrase [Phycisphaerales bacterium]|jgi:site-specific recombinase XerD|nr:tyrosine-type recombinase/integrase [Phycisphaerales bacterium]
MSGDLAGVLGVGPGSVNLPMLVAESGEETRRRYLEFFAAHIRNPNTRAAYLIAAEKFFAWCELHGIVQLERVQRLHVAAYVEELTRAYSAPTVKQNLAALRMMFDYLRVPAANPAEGVRGPRHVVRTGRTPVLSGAEARRLLDSIDTRTLAGLRDRAMIAVMIYTFGRVSAVVGMDVDDYHMNGARRWVRFREKGGREHALPLHHMAEDCLEAYLSSAGLEAGPLFRTLIGRDVLTVRRLSRFAAWEMVKRRAINAGLPPGTTNHTFRATGITCYLENGGTLENARNIAAHASVRTTQVYDRRDDKVTLDEISRIRL